MSDPTLAIVPQIAGSRRWRIEKPSATSSADKTPGKSDMRARSRIVFIYILLLAANAAAWAWALLALRDYPVLLGTGLLAYTFGLRHAVDADHIAAIDNVTRKLMQQGKKPVAVGFFFALGHSTIVALGAGAVALTTTELDTRFAALKDIGGVIGTAVSALFLLLIATMNLFILRGVFRSFQRVRRGERYVEADFDMLSAQGGAMARLFRPLFGLMNAS
jgi:nickel/cobalt transporter (NiCoT) family protein